MMAKTACAKLSLAELASVRGAQADPFVLDLIEMDGRIILRNVQVEVGGGKPADGAP